METPFELRSPRHMAWLVMCTQVAMDNVDGLLSTRASVFVVPVGYALASALSMDYLSGDSGQLLTWIIG